MTEDNNDKPGYDGGASLWTAVIGQTGWDCRATSEIMVGAWQVGHRQRVTISVNNAAIHVSRTELEKLRELIDSAVAQLWPEKG